jgi:hypothetical protein
VRLALEVCSPFAQDVSVDHDERNGFIPKLRQLGFRLWQGPGNERRVTAGQTDLLHHILDCPVLADDEDKHGCPHTL